MDQMVITKIAEAWGATDLLQKHLFQLDIIAPQPTNSMFFYWKNMGEKNFMQLNVMSPETSPAMRIQDMFTEADVPVDAYKHHEYGLSILVNALCNRVAIKTRRGCANKIILGQKLGSELLQQRMKLQHKPLYDIILSDLVPENEIWATYVKVNVNDETNRRIIDGGAYVDLDGLKLNPNWKFYFLKKTLHD